MGGETADGLEQLGLFRHTADVPGSPDKSLAVFNTNDPKTGKPGEAVPVEWAELELTGRATVRDLWRKQDAGEHADRFTPEIPWPGAGLYRVSPVR